LGHQNLSMLQNGLHYVTDIAMNCSIPQAAATGYATAASLLHKDT
jgi:hypothetical protein